MGDPNSYLEDDPVIKQFLGSEAAFTDAHWKIIEAAVQVFSEKGFSASRTREIALEAGVSEGTIFNYFKTKKDLLLGLLAPLFSSVLRPMLLHGVTHGVKRIIGTRPGRDIEDVMNDLARDRLALLRSNFPLIKTVFVEGLYHPELLKPIESILPKILEIGVSIIEDEIAAGTFRQVDPLTAVRMFISVIAGYGMMRSIFPDSVPWQDDEVEVRRMIDMYLHGVKAMARAEVDAGK